MDNSKQYSNSRSEINVSIANGATESSVINTHGTSLGALFLPANMIGSTIKIKASRDGNTFSNIRTSKNNVVELQFTAGDCVLWQFGDLKNVQYFKLVTDVAQTADVQIVAATSPV